MECFWSLSYLFHILFCWWTSCNCIFLSHANISIIIVLVVTVYFALMWGCLFYPKNMIYHLPWFFYSFTSGRSLLDWTGNTWPTFIPYKVALLEEATSNMSICIHVFACCQSISMHAQCPLIVAQARPYML